jgi:hypothetical protein
VPILHSQITAHTKSPDVKVLQVAPATALQLRGPLFQVSITVEQNLGKGLIAQGKTPPAPKSGLARVDTGASNTCIDELAAKELGLPVIDVANMQSASHEKHPCNIYPVQIITPIVTLNAPRAMGAALSSQGLLVLIGRDVQQKCTLFYNGPAGQFTLTV